MQDRNNSHEESFSQELERRVMQLGQEILTRAGEIQARQGTGERWVNNLLERSMADDAFRVKALRFIDVLPVLTNDMDLLRHLHEYFDQEELPLPKPVRALFASSHNALAAGLIAPMVRRGATALSERFLGGATLDDVQATLEKQTEQGVAISLDRLGEAVVSDTEAMRYLASYNEILEHLNHTPGGGDGRELNLSLKISSLYPRMTARDPQGAVDGVLGRLRPLLQKAREKGVSVCLDMEQYDLKGIILDCFRQMMLEPEFSDWPGGGIAIQSYLKDASADLDALLQWSQERQQPVTIRLVRGAYWDQELILSHRDGWPLPVWRHKHQTDRSFETCLRKLFQAHTRLRPAVATHNVRSMALAMALAEESGAGRDGFEFQMLYGMGDALRSAIVEMGYRVRLYTPFGEMLPGMAYLVRRILENSSSQSFLHLGYLPEEEPGQLLQPSYGPEHEAEQAMPAAGFHNEAVHRFTDREERAAFADAIEQAKVGLGGDYPLIIDGRQVETATWIDSINPARPEQLVGRVCSAGSREAEQAVTAATTAFTRWSATSTGERAALLRRAAGQLRLKRDEFAAWELLEAGKNWPEADADVAEAIDFLEYYANQAERLDVGHHSDVMGEGNHYHYAPRGVALILPPWNFPLAIVTGMLSAALVTGNTAILKPSSQTPVVAARLVQLLMDAGFPSGVVNYLPGPGDAVGEYLVKHPDISIIAFTGSVEVGLHINRLAADTAPGQAQVKRVIAEMGGKNAIIVDSSADMDEAVLGTVASAFGYQGQKCSACSRVIVVGEAYAMFRQRLSDAIASLRVGLPEDPGADLGPVIEAAAKERIEHAIGLESEINPPVISMDLSGHEPGFFVGPTLFADVDPHSPLAQEEIFGPVLAMIRADDFTQALEIANNTRYALTGGVYSRSPANLKRAAEEFQVGNLYLNRGITGALVGRQPFGGFKMSGVGSKAGGPDYLLQFMEPRTVTENTMRRGYAPMD
jgi:RHH-type transcriptional regulator, proline utilization regulon repressor / proline dehydrogenase / delta 1-pyrroline-5-carboxylate dehydrogenase